MFSNKVVKIKTKRIIFPISLISSELISGFTYVEEKPVASGRNPSQQAYIKTVAMETGPRCAKLVLNIWQKSIHMGFACRTPIRFKTTKW